MWTPDFERQTRCLHDARMMDKGVDEVVVGPNTRDGVDGVDGVDGDQGFLGWQRVEVLCIDGDRGRHERVSPL